MVDSSIRRPILVMGEGNNQYGVCISDCKNQLIDMSCVSVMKITIVNSHAAAFAYNWIFVFNDMRKQPKCVGLGV